MITRNIEKKLDKWFSEKNPKPLLLHGIRQVGKTHAVHGFSGKAEQFLEFDLKQPDDRIFFEKNLFRSDFHEGIFFRKNKNPHKPTLLFLDNLSASDKAVQWATGYQSERNLSVIATACQPIPAIDAMHLRPLSFYEFLLAMDEKTMAAAYLEVPYPPGDFDKLIRLFHLYTLIGGMPEIVQNYAEARELADLQPVYEKIQELFMKEIEEKIFTRKVQERARMTLQNAFPYAANRIKFNHFGSTPQGSRDCGRMLRMLEKIGLLKLIYPVVGDGIVEKTEADRTRSPRLQLPDTGLVNYFSGIQKQIFEANDLLGVFDGQIARHVAGQEILFYEDDLKWWIRSKPQSKAEVDFLLPFEENSIPVEIKAGETGRLRSLFQYVDQSPHPFAVRLWGNQLMVKQAETIRGKKFYLLNLPYFLAGRIREYLPGFMHLVTR